VVFAKARVDQVLAVGTAKFLKLPLFSIGSECSLNQRPCRLLGCFLEPEQPDCGFGRSVAGLVYETRVYVAGVEHRKSGNKSRVNKKRNYLPAAIVLREVMRLRRQFPASQFATICVVLNPLVASALVDPQRRAAPRHCIVRSGNSNSPGKDGLGQAGNVLRLSSESTILPSLSR
jgi:hypothetical protein